jgi:hypothetical protein
MKSFYFHDLRSHGELPGASTRNLLPCAAVVSAESLGAARRCLRDVGLSAKSFRRATASEAKLVEDHEPGTVAWTTSDLHGEEWVIGQTVDAYVRGSTPAEVTCDACRPSLG